MEKRKIFVLDTSVLLYDKNAITSFPGNDVILPVVVLDELDNFKERSGLLGESARHINRYLFSLMKEGKLSEGIEIEDDQTIAVCLHAPSEVDDSHELSHFDLKVNDNKIIATALYLKQANPDKDVVVVSKDINLMVKCGAIDISSEDYHSDYIAQSHVDEMFAGVREFETDKGIIDSFWGLGTIDKDLISDDLHPNEFVIGKSSLHKSSSMVGIVKGDSIVKIKNLHDDNVLEAKNTEQNFCLNLLNDPEIDLVTITGKAGTGKTFITLVSAIEQMRQGRYKRIVVTRTMQAVGRDIGFLPGDISDKVEPWMGSIKDNYVAAYGTKSKIYYDMMLEKGEIEIAPMALMRGRTFNDAFIIVDEAQNSSIHELKTITTRVGENTKIVLLGDIEQIDTPYLNEKSSGLSIVIDKLRSEDITGHVHLVDGERSRLATMCSKLL